MYCIRRFYGLVSVALVVLLFASAAGVSAVADSGPECPSWCDCEQPKSGTAACVSSITQCGGLADCTGNATELDSGADAWPSGCKSSRVTVGEVVNFDFVNCKRTLTHCNRSTTCMMAGQTCVPNPNGQKGDWTDVGKPEIEDCEQL